jgi:glycolate oxidase iron-sulfur subunit
MDPALLADCVHCGFCLPTCPTYALWHEEMDSPRGRIWLMQATVDGTMELNATVVQHFDRCLGCLACVTACPSGVRYGTLIELARERVEDEHRRPLGERTLRRVVFATVPHRRRLRIALALAPLGRRLPVPERFRPLLDLAPPWRDAAQPPQVTPAEGAPVARVGLLTGCVQSVVFGGVNRATARVLAAHGCEVVTAYRGCCGALALHAGRRGEGLEGAARAIEAFEQAGVDVVVTNAAGCGSHLRETAGALEVRDVAELLQELEPRRPLAPLPLRVAYQDACHLAHGLGVRVAPRDVLSRIPELELVEPGEQELCCGSAGIYNLVQPAAARELGDRKAACIVETAPDVYASGNPGCLVQVSAALRRRGRPIPAFHPVELVDASLRGVAVEPLLSSARR